MRRWCSRILIATLCVPLLAVLTAPWWLGAVLGWAGPRWLGLEFDRYERLPGARVELTDLAWRGEGVTVRAERVELDSPWRWLRAWLTDAPLTVIEIGPWAVEVEAQAEKPAAPRATADAPGGWLATRERIEARVDTLTAWLPPVTASAGVVRWPDGELRVGAASLRDRRLEADFLEWNDWRADDLVLERAGAEWRFAARDHGGQWSAEVLTAGDDVRVSGQLWEQPWTFEAEFGERGWRPRVAVLDATGWALSGARFGWEQAYREITGDLRAAWRDARLEFSVRAAGEPVGDVPALRVELAGAGDEDEIALERAIVRALGVTATLDEPVRMSTAGRLLSGESRFSLQADLAALAGPGARGALGGRVLVRPGKEGWPEVDARLAADGVEARGWRIEKMETEARLRWPELVVEAARIMLPGEERLVVSGRYDLTARSLSEGRVEGRLTTTTYGPWLPGGVGLGEIELKATARGVWPELAHDGEVRFKDLRVDGLRPVDGKADWRGHGASADELRLAARVEGAELAAAGAVDRESLDLAELRLSEGDTLQWRLTEPARVRWAPTPRIANLAMEGAAGSLRAAGDAAGFSVDVESVGTDWLRPWLTDRVPAVTLERLALQGAWAEGPLVATLRARVRSPLGQTQTVTADLDLASGADGVWLNTLNVGTGDRPVATAQGRLPLVIRPAAERRFDWLPDGPLRLTARTDPAARFWSWLADLSGLTLENPSIDVQVGGTWSKPEGGADLSVARVAADPARWPRTLPELRDLRGRLRGGSDGLFLERLTAEVAGQRVVAEGGLKAPPDRWPELLAEPARLAEAGGTLRLQIPDAEVAALARFMPQVLAPTGRLQLELALREGGGWDGFLKLTDAASRPLGPLGVLGDVNADIRLRDHAVELANVSARVGGQPVALAGSLDLRDWRNPAPSLTLKGKGLPLVRRSGVLVRADLDLVANTDAATGRVTVGGTVGLRDSLLLADLRSLLPGGGGPRGPARRPPYFSVDVEPLDGWTLDVALRGERFLRVRTPLFNGVMSARFRLGGTLGGPLLVGEAPVEEGVVRLPFASFTMEQGMVYIPASDPSQPRLRLAATGRSYGYDLRMELSGAASSPELTFSSTPPLSSEQVLLMVMAGETPSNEITFTTSQRAVRVGAYLGQSLLDTFGVRSGASDRLTINVGERISRQGRETYDVNYELTDDWSLTGEYSEFDDYNAGVKWRFYTSEPPREKEEADDAAR